MSNFRFILLFCLLSFFSTVPAYADAFIVGKIKIKGLQRLTDGALLNYLPIVVGDPIDDEQITYAIAELYKTGFFADVKLFRDKSLLIIDVTERPSIASVKFSGNSEIEDDALEKALKSIEVEKGKIYNRSLLEKLTLELENVYFSQGKYGVKLETKITALDQNRVDVEIDIYEGDIALIKHVNIIGNDNFSNATLLSEMESGVPSAWAVFSSADEYSKPKLNGDLEKIRSYYLDRGFIHFAIESTQVSISPDKKDIYVTINVSEGERYKVSNVQLNGKLVVNRQTMESQIQSKTGDYFSRAKVTNTKKELERQMGRVGYAFSQIQVTPVIDEDKKEVAITFFSTPGEKVFVRRINITGNDSAQDYVYRREIRLMEGSILASDLLERSKIRIQRLPYIETVDIKPVIIPGSNNQVDLDVAVSEKPAGSFNVGAGFSQTKGLTFNIGLTEENLLGSGNRLAVNINTDKANTIYSVAYTDPYYTNDGISRSISFSYRTRDAEEEDINNFQTNSGDLRVNYGVPLSEFNTVNFGYGASYIKIIPSTTNPSTDVVSFLDEHNGETSFSSLNLSSSFVHDTRNRTIFATEGTRQVIGAKITIPGSDLEYYKINYSSRTYFGVTKDTAFLLRAKISYGDGYGKTEGLPFFERYFAGGIRTVRGFRSSSLGPRDVKSDLPIGGNMRVTGGLDYIFPIPFLEKAPSSVRLLAFYDVGNVFLDGVNTFDASSDEEGFQSSQLRSSVGLSLVWISPIGPLRFSYAKTLDDVEDDDLRAFQFSLGTIF